jgi:hypothetical protein
MLSGLPIVISPIVQLATAVMAAATGVGDFLKFIFK